ncbi:MAE_28990/MAE_18760 family HEPN-like nuclease [Sphingobacterium siyangense]|uniref:MAE_28990/MAE_18760 family HEPN-like nuclease n=1 Tax=Sphingobacterium siyangense TaxID=459529 RepID=UPI003DA2D2C6
MIIKEEFEKRALEIDSFYEILEIIEHESPKITAYDIEMMGEKTLAVNSSKIDTLRSTAYLLLYNLIESTIYNSITSIFDEIKDNRLKYFDLIEDLQKYWLNNLYKHDDKKRKETVIETIMKVANQIFNDTAYSGDVDPIPEMLTP